MFTGACPLPESTKDSTAPRGTFATCGADAAVKLWDVRSTSQAEKCAQTASAQTEAVWGVAFSPSDDKLASASDDKSVAVYQYVP